jgi:hypothetical protein
MTGTRLDETSWIEHIPGWLEQSRSGRPDRG